MSRRGPVEPLPKCLRKKRKQAEEAPKRVPENNAFLDLTIVRDVKWNILTGVYNGTAYEILDPDKVTEGEVWTCQAGRWGIGKPSGYAAIPLTRVSEAPSATVGEDTADETTETVPVETTPVTVSERKELEELRAKMEEMEEKVRAAKQNIRTLERRDREIRELKETVRTRDVTIGSLKVQVKSLEGKGLQAQIGNLTSERDHYKAMYESQMKIIDDLRARNALYESGCRKDPNMIATILTGPTGIHCNLLDDGRYRVYYSPGRKTLRFIRDENGRVTCRDGDVTIPIIKGASAFDRFRVLRTTNDNGEIVVSLEE